MKAISMTTNFYNLNKAFFIFLYESTIKCAEYEDMVHITLVHQLDVAVIKVHTTKVNIPIQPHTPHA